MNHPIDSDARLELRERLSEDDPDFACLEDAIAFLDHLGEHETALALCDVLDRILDREERRMEADGSETCDALPDEASPPAAQSELW